MKVDFALAELDAEIQPRRYAGHRERIHHLDYRVAGGRDLWGDVYCLAEHLGVAKEKRGAVVKEGWALPHDVPDHSVYPSIVNCKVNIRLVGKSHSISLLARLK